jgi:hypothetical protein
MIRKVIAFGVILFLLVGSGCSDNSKKDPMRNWGTKKSTAVPPKDFP